MTTANKQYSQLEELSNSNYEVVDGQPNIIGWSVKLDEEFNVGTVKDLLFDSSTQSVRYLIVKLISGHQLLQHEIVLIPIGIAQLYTDTDLVLLPNISLQQITALPPYQHSILNADLESKTRKVFLGTSPEGAVDPEIYDREGFYDHQHFNEDHFYNPQQQQATAQQPTVGQEAAQTISRIAQRPSSPAYNKQEGDPESNRDLPSTDHQ